jgi:hypothetical protein
VENASWGLFQFVKMTFGVASFRFKLYGFVDIFLNSVEKPPIVRLLKNFPAFYGTRRFIAVLTRALHWSLS